MSPGFSIIEILVAVGIVAVIIGVASYFVTGSKSLTKRVGSSQECELLVQNALLDFKNEDNRLNVYNNLFDPQEFPGQERRGVPLESGGVLANFQNVENAATRIFQLYQNNPTICGGAGVDLLAHPQVLKKMTFNSTGLQRFVLKASLVDAVSNGMPSCSEFTNLRIPGIGTTSNYLIKIQAEADYQTTEGTTSSCQSETTVSYQPDLTAPAISVAEPEGSSDGGVTWVPNIDPVNTICDTQVARIGLSSTTEAGVIFMCANADVASSYVNCHGFIPTGGVPGEMIQAGELMNAPTQAYLRFNNIPEGQYNFFVKGFDTAGNSSGAGVPVQMTIDLTRPDWAAPRNLTSVADPTLGNRRVVDTPSGLLYSPGMPAADPRAVAFGSTRFQCAPTNNPTFEGPITGTLFGNESCSGRVESSVASNTRASSALTSTLTGTTCRLVVPAQSGFNPGDATVIGTVQDVCNDASDPPRESNGLLWFIDPRLPEAATNTITARHAPSSHAATSPQVIPVVPYNQSIAPRMSDVTWTLSHQRSIAALANAPVVWDFMRHNGTYTSVKVAATTAATSTFSGAELQWSTYGNTCDYSVGSCARLTNGCGEDFGSTNISGQGTAYKYAIRGTVGDTCREVPCEAGLSCSTFGGNIGFCQSMDQRSCGGAAGNLQWRCTTDPDCGFGGVYRCIGSDGVTMNSGLCAVGVDRICNAPNTANGHKECKVNSGALAGALGRCGSYPGRSDIGLCTCPDESALGYVTGVRTGQDANCPSDASVCSGSAPNCICNAATAAGLCSFQSFANECGIANACRGTLADNHPNCSIDNIIRPLEAYCPLTDASVLNTFWLDAQNDKTVMQRFQEVTGQGLNAWANFGVPETGNPRYHFKCRTDATPWTSVAETTSCNYANWPESPERPNHRNRNTFEMQVTDARGDEAVINCTYRKDETPPFWSPAPSVAAGSCGSPAKPTLGTNVSLSYKADDTRTPTRITITNFDVATVAPIQQNNVNVNNDSFLDVTIGVSGSSLVDNNRIRFLVVDNAGNSITYEHQVAIASNTGLRTTFNEGVLPNKWTKDGCMGCPGGGNRPLTNTISGTNQYNWVSAGAGAVTLRRFASKVGPDVNDSLPLTNYTGSAMSRSNNQYYMPASWWYTVENWFVDSCGNATARFTSDLKVDWDDPVLSRVCDSSPECGMNVNSSDVSGIKVWNVNCSPYTLPYTKDQTGAYFDTIVPGTNSTCDVSATDRAGNQASYTANCNCGCVPMSCPPPEPGCTQSSPADYDPDGCQINCPTYTCPTPTPEPTPTPTPTPTDPCSVSAPSSFAIKTIEGSRCHMWEMAYINDDYVAVCTRCAPGSGITDRPRPAWCCGTQEDSRTVLDGDGSGGVACTLIVHRYLCSNYP